MPATDIAGVTMVAFRDVDHGATEIRLTISDEVMAGREMLGWLDLATVHQASHEGATIADALATLETLVRAAENREGARE